jgi:Domain of Unknown Function (DUF1080)/Domain of unknown function (DUF3471)
MKASIPNAKILCSILLTMIWGITAMAQEENKSATPHWKIHDMSRPKSPLAHPLEQSLPAPHPDNAIVLFEGSDFSHWTGSDNKDPRWKIENGYMEIVPGTGAIQTKESFGDVFLHVEWASPDDPTRRGQDRGNSGIFFMGQYELQVLDSYQADTYTDGQAGALYGQAPPRFNACKPRGEWNAYDIEFRRPRFATNGKLLSPARITVIHNGILIQDNEEYWGPTSWLKFLPYKAHADKLPFSLQEHNGKVRFRNIWALALPELPAPGKSYGVKTISLQKESLSKFTGVYNRPNAKAPILVTLKDGKLYGDFYYRPGPLELVPLSGNEFELKETDAQVSFKQNNKGIVTELIFHIGGEDMPAEKAAK